MLDVAAGGLRRDRQALGDLLVRPALGQQLEHLDLPRREPGRPLAPPRYAVARAGQYRVGRLRVAGPGRDVGAQLRRRLVAGELRPVGARLAHRLVGVGGPEQPCWAADGGAGQRGRIAGAVEPLAQLNGDRPERSERPGLMEHPLGQMRVHADAFPLSSAQRAGAVPNRVRHPQPAEAVDEARATKRSHLGLGEPELLARACREIGHRLGVPQPVRRLDIDRRRNRCQRSIEALARHEQGQ